jgi:hypothetical protein
MLQDGVIAMGRKKKKDIEKNGVKGVWHCANLPYADIAKHVCWDGFHTLLNVAKNTIEVLKGERGMSEKIINFCKLSRRHPSLYTGKLKVIKIPRNNTTFKAQNSKKNIPSEKKEIFVPIWRIRKRTQKLIDLWLQAVLCPIGYKQNFAVHDLFGRTGNLQGRYIIQAITVLMDYILFCIMNNENSFHVAYAWYLSLLSEDFSKLQAPEFTDEEIVDLYQCVTETVSLHESIYPPTESLIVYHQLVDIPDFISKFGPIRGFWTLPEERAISAIKRNVPKGGANNYITVTNRQCDIETEIYTKSYNFDITDCKSEAINISSKDLFNRSSNQIKNNKIVVSDQSFVLQDSFHDLKMVFTRHEIEALFAIYIVEIQKYCLSEEDALIKSGYYRLYKSFLITSEKSMSFLDWLQMKYTEENLNIEYNNNVENDSAKILEFLQKGKIFIQDHDIIGPLLQICINLYRRAIIYGTGFRSRGDEHRERELIEKCSDIQECNNLMTNWSICNSYSSWCKIKVKKTSRTVPLFGYEKENYKDCYAQFNFFFQLSLPGDDILHGLKIASVTCRKSEMKARLHIISCANTDSYESNMNSLFVPLTNVYSTPVAIAGFSVVNKMFKPIIIKRCQGDAASKVPEDMFLSDEFCGTVAKLVMIDICRPRLKLGFENNRKEFYNEINFN